MNTHSIDSLSDDEIQVECLVRNIDFSNTIDWLDVLKGQLIAEEEDPSLTPAKTHATDVKTEYQLCYEQAVAFEKKIKDADSLEQLKSLNARIRHWIERTSRLKGCFRQDREVDQVITKWRTNRLLAEKQIEIYLNPTGGDLSLTNPGRLEFHLDPTLGNPNFVPTTKYVTNQSSPIRSKLSFSNSVTELKHPAQVYNTNTLATSTNMYDTVSMSTNYNQPRKMQTSTNTTQVNPNYPTATARVSNHAMPPVNQFQNNIVPYFEQQINRYNPKWNISFSGSPQDMDVTDFIFRLESHARRDRVSLTDLEAFLPRFLQGTAEKWYWSFAKKTPNATYNVFREAILSRFRSHVTEREMRRIVETRKQKPRESFHDFLLEMECLNSRLQCSFQDSEFLEIIRDNMDPALQSATLSSVIRSIDELRIICQRFEKLWQNSGHDPRQLTESKFRRTYNVNAIYQNPNNSVRLTENVEEISKSMPELPEPTQPYVEAFSNNPNQLHTNLDGLTKSTNSKNPKYINSYTQTDIVDSASTLKKLAHTDLSSLSKRFSRIIQYWKKRKINQHLCESTIICGKDDPRPHVKVNLFGKTLVGLLDSGASITVLGRGAEVLLSRAGIKMNKMTSCVKTADGTKNKVLGFINQPITYDGKTKIIKLYIAPSLEGQLYLGIHFWQSFSIAPLIISELSDNEPNEHVLTEDQKQELESIKDSYPSYNKHGLGRTHVLEHKIDVGDSSPVKQRHYPVSPAVQKLIYGELDRMLSMGVIEESESAWSSPVVLVRKQNGKVRLCLDSRKVNSLTKKDAFPIPNIDGLLGRLSETRFITGIDLKDAFWQIPLEINSRDKTAFSVPGRPLYQFRVMPFGLCNSPQTMSRLMSRVIPHEYHDQIFVYLDDLLIISSTIDEHFKLLRLVSTWLNKAGLTINVEKSRFMMRELKYLGYVIGEDGLKTDPGKIEAILDFPAPASVKQTRRLLGMTGWYQRFILNYATVTAPITDLLKKGNRFTWTSEAQTAFDRLKLLLTTAPVLSNPDYTKPFSIRCDASTSGVGGVLFQYTEDNQERPIAFVSKKLNPAQKNYSISELECLAAILSIKKFRPYIEGFPFKVITDHSSLKWLMSQKDLSGRLARWSLKLQAYDFIIEHEKGSRNVVPDALSRAYCDSIEEVGCDWPLLVNSIDLDSDEFNNSKYSEFRDQIISNPEKYPNFAITNNRILIRIEPRLDQSLTDLPVWKLWIPETLTQQLIYEEHDIATGAHGGIKKTLDRLRRYYFWPRMRTQVHEYIVRCTLCKMMKSSNVISRPPMGSFHPADRPWQRIFVDFMGPYPRSKMGNTVIFVVVDQFSKFVLLKPLPSAISLKIVSFLKNDVFLTFGTPEILVSDNGTQFKSKIFQKLLNDFEVSHLFTALYSPQANASERVNRSILSAIRAYLKNEHRSWDEHIGEIGSALRNAIHQSTQYSPYFALFGYHMVTRVLRDDFRSIPKDAVALVGGPVILNCTPPRGIPEPSVLWYKDSKILDIAGKRLSMVDSGSLMISEVQASDAGKYECSAQSMAGSKTSPPAFLKVLAPPTVIKGPQDTEVIEGEGLDLPCELTGDPKPIVSWYRENGNLPEGRSRILLDNTLRIEETRPEDQGGYVCNGHNEGGNVTVAVELFVYATPTFLEAPADSEVKEGQTIKIPCRAQGRPQTRIVWDRVVWSMPNPGSGISNTNLQSSTTVTQEVSKIIEQDTHEELLAKAKIMSLRSKRNEVNKTSGIGSRVRRNVVVDLPEMKQIPELYVDPNNDRNKRDQDQNFLMSEFKLIMRNDNEDSYDTTFRKRKRRRRKRDVTNEGTSDTNGEKINDGSGNNLEEVEEDEDAEINENENENEDGLSVPTPTISLSTTSPMEQNTQLEISVNGELVIRDATEKDQGWYACAALNEAGSIVKKIYLRVVSASDTSGTTKVPDIPGSRWGSEQTIVISTITPISSSSLEVNWDITNEIVPSTILTLHYRSIEAAGTSNLGKDFQIVTTQLDLKEYTLTELKPHTEYEIFASVPSSLSGSVSNIRKGKTLDGPPSAPPTDVRVGVINNTAAYVRWSPPPTHLLNGELTGYRIQIKSNITNKLLGQMSLNATTQSVVINSLSPGGRYIARVAPFTAGGLGPYSPPAPLHMDPSFIARPPKSDPTSTGWNSAWMSGIALGILGICLVGGAIFAVFWARRNKRNMKASYPAGPILTTTIPDKQHTLWLHGNPMVVKTSHSLAPPAPPSSQGSEYAEVTNNMMPSMKMMNSNSTTTTTNTSTSAPPEPYATVTLKRGAGGVMNNNQGGLVLGPQSDDSCVKMCSNSPSSSEYNAPSREPLNLCDILPPPPDHPYGAYKPPNNMTIRTNPAAMSPQVMRRIPATPPRWGTLPPPIPNFPQNWMTQRTTRMTPHGTNDLNNHHQHYNHDFPHGYLGYHQNDDENDYESGSVLYEQCRQQQQQQQLDSYFNNGGEPTEEYYRNVNNMEYYDDSYEPSTPPPPCPDLNLYNNKNNLRLYQNNHNKNQLQQQQAPPQHQHQQQQNHPQYHQDPNMLNQKRIINRNIVGNIPNSIVINPNTNPNSLQISHQNGVVGMVVNGGSNGISNCVNGGASSSNTPSGQSSEEDSESDNNRWVPRSRRSRSRSKSSDRKYRNGGQMGQIR